MNLPNALTLIRLPLTFAIVALMYGIWPWAATLAFWLYIAAAITDWLDGKLARERNSVSDFGKFMDALVDKVLVIGIMVALLDLGYLRLPGAFVIMLVLMVITREFMISGLRMMAAARGVVMAAERGGKVDDHSAALAGVPAVRADACARLAAHLSFPARWRSLAGPLDRPRALLRVDVVHVFFDVELLPEIPARVV